MLKRGHHLIVLILCFFLATQQTLSQRVYAEDLLINFFELYSSQPLPVSSASEKKPSKSSSPTTPVVQKKSSETKNVVNKNDSAPLPSQDDDPGFLPDQRSSPESGEETEQAVTSKNVGMEAIELETLLGPSGNPILNPTYRPENEEKERLHDTAPTIYEALIGPSGKKIETATPDHTQPESTTDSPEPEFDPESETDPEEKPEVLVVEETLVLTLHDTVSIGGTEIETLIPQPQQDTPSSSVLATRSEMPESFLTDNNKTQTHTVIIEEGTEIVGTENDEITEEMLQIWQPSKEEQALFEEPILESVAFGLEDNHLTFSHPVEIRIPVDPSLEGHDVAIYAYHHGDEKFSDHGLTTNPDASCQTDGTTLLTSNTVTVHNGVATIFTCGASAFVVTYTGGATADNFVDNSTITKTITVTTGDASPGLTVESLRVIVDFWSIDGRNRNSPGINDSYSNELSMSITSPQGTTVSLLAFNTYNNYNAPRVTVTFADSASSLPSAIPSTGTFDPAQALSLFNGENIIGNRTFSMSDNGYDDGAILYGVSLDFVSTNCGDGDMDAGEACDDGNITNNDGCSGVCAIEQGRECSGQPSSCNEMPVITGLVVRLDGSKNAALFADISGNGNHATSFNTVTTGVINGETYMCFNGSNKYLEINAPLITNYPFSVSTRIKPTAVSGLRGIVSFAKPTVANVLYNLEHNSTTIRMSAQNTTARYTNATTPLNTANRFLLTSTYTSATNRRIYVNGSLQGTQTTSVTFDTNPNKRRNIGRLADSTPSNYYNGCLDDVRIYNTALSAGEVQTLFTRPSILSTTLTTASSPLLTGTITALDRITITVNGNTYTGTNLNNGRWLLPAGTISPALPNGTYPVTMTVTTPYNTTAIHTGSFQVQLPAPTGEVTITAPTTLTFGTVVQPASISQTIEQTSSTHFSVYDTLGTNSGYYTTLSVTTLSGQYIALPNSSLERKGFGITTLSGSVNNAVVLGSAFSSYTPATGTVTFIKRDVGANNGLIGRYGTHLQLRLTIPPYTRPGAYQGTITYTLYEN